MSNASDDPAPGEALTSRWLVAALDAVGVGVGGGEPLSPDTLDRLVGIVLDLARDAAHGVARPAAPLGAFALGLALGRSGSGPADLDAIDAIAATIVRAAGTFESA